MQARGIKSELRSNDESGIGDGGERYTKGWVFFLFFSITWVQNNRIELIAPLYHILDSKILGAQVHLHKISYLYITCTSNDNNINTM